MRWLVSVIVREVFCTMWGAAVSNPPSHYHYVQGTGPMLPSGPSGPILAGSSSKHLRPQSSYSLPHGSNGPGRWGWSGNNVSSFDRRQLKVPPQPVRPAPVRPSHTRYTGTNVSFISYFETVFLLANWYSNDYVTFPGIAYSDFMSWCNAFEPIGVSGVIYFLVYCISQCVSDGHQSAHASFNTKKIYSFL